jgi:hypothetical protein
MYVIYEKREIDGVVVDDVYAMILQMNPSSPKSSPWDKGNKGSVWVWVDVRVHFTFD